MLLALLLSCDEAGAGRNPPSQTAQMARSASPSAPQKKPMLLQITATGASLSVAFRACD